MSQCAQLIEIWKRRSEARNEVQDIRSGLETNVQSNKDEYNTVTNSVNDAAI